MLIFDYSPCDFGCFIPTGPSDYYHFFLSPDKRTLKEFKNELLILSSSHIKWWLLLPLVGMGSFVLLYLVAANQYPGGSWAYPAQVGFSWRHNYLCDLLDTHAVNGVLNPGRYWARAALGILCAGLLVLWVQLPRLMNKSYRLKTLMLLSGLAAFGATVFLSSGTHDLTVRIAGVFGSIALLSALLGFLRNGHRGLCLFGCWCLGIFLLNYAIYETGGFLRALPLIQKFTFTSFLAWFVWIDIALIRMYRRTVGNLAEENSINIS
jgi:hypothetical protein